ncbi:unnamed protein product, partial [Didymodactylos carnosus]
MSTSSRIFSFGLGASPSRSLIKGLARTTNGRFVFIPPNTQVDVHVAEQLEKALQPCITNVQVKWNLDGIETVPSETPPVYANDRLIIYGLIEKADNFDHTTTVELHKNEVQLGVAKVDRVPSNGGDQMINRLAAKALIRELQHFKQPSSAAINKGSLQTRFQQQEEENTTIPPPS